MTTTARPLRATRPRLWTPVLGWSVAVALLILWELVGRFADNPSITTFSASLEAAVAMLTGPDLVNHLLPSLGRMFLGYGVAAVAGVAVGLLIGSIRALDRWVVPSIEFFRSVPPSLIVPVALLIFGLGSQLVVFVVSFGAFWPILLNTIDGVRRVEPLYLETARSLRIGFWRRLVRICVPAALPMIMAGLRIGLSISLIVMVVAEVLGSNNGIGYLVTLAQQTFNVAGTYGGVLLLAVLGWALDTAFVAVEHRVLSWHSSFRKGSDVS